MVASKGDSSVGASAAASAESSVGSSRVESSDSTGQLAATGHAPLASASSAAALGNGARAGPSAAAGAASRGTAASGTAAGTAGQADAPGVRADQVGGSDPTSCDAETLPDGGATGTERMLGGPYAGVERCPGANGPQWRAYLTAGRRQSRDLGKYFTPVMAAIAYDKALVEAQQRAGDSHRAGLEQLVRNLTPEQTALVGDGPYVPSWGRLDDPDLECGYEEGCVIML